MYWLRKRLGSTGKPRLRILEKLAHFIPAETCHNLTIGLSHSELYALSEYWRMNEIPQHFSSRGNTDVLCQIAWCGSALGDIACADDKHTDSALLKEAALFNLGIALFDTIAEEYPKKIIFLARALEPVRMKNRLLHPTSPEFSISCTQPELNLIARLFDAVLSSVGLRLFNDKAHLVYLADLLKKMYESELRISNDPYLAKTLPIVFIGGLANHLHKHSIQMLFDNIAFFLCYWDDWLDLATDMFHMAPNVFLGKPVLSQPIQIIAYLYRCAMRVFGGSSLHKQFIGALEQPLKSALEISSKINNVTYEKTISFFNYLLA